MRKLLLATAAIVGGSMGVADLAFAQTTPFVPNANAYTTGPVASINGAAGPIVPAQYGAPYTAYPSPTAGPGTITVRLNARVAAYMQAGSDSGRNPGLVTTAAGSAPTRANTKLADYSFNEYARLFPRFDGIAGNGLKYGGFIEVRQDNSVAPGGGINGSISGKSNTRNALYVRKQGIYLGGDNIGFIRFGSTDNPATLFATGTFENFDTGGWDGDQPGFFTGNSGPAWPFPDIGGFNTTSKIVYLSPQLFGFDLAASFAPNSGNGSDIPGVCSYANTGTGVGCDAATSTTVSGETSRPRDIAEVAFRYRGAFGPVGLAVQAGGIFSGKVLNANVPAVKATQTLYDGYMIGDGGVIVSFGGLAVGGHVTGGRSNGVTGLVASDERDSFAWLAGASYAIGPIVFGGSYFDFRSAGSRVGKAVTSPLVGDRNEYGVAAGLTYNFAGGMNLFASYLYGHRKQTGVDLLTGVASTGTAVSGFVGTHNNTQAQGVMVGSLFTW